jgi:hypothetical protein
VDADLKIAVIVMSRPEAKQTIVWIFCFSGKSKFVFGVKRTMPSRGMALRAGLTCC